MVARKSMSFLILVQIDQTTTILRSTFKIGPSYDVLTVIYYCRDTSKEETEQNCFLKN